MIFTGQGGKDGFAQTQRVAARSDAGERIVEWWHVDGMRIGSCGEIGNA